MLFKNVVCMFLLPTWHTLSLNAVIELSVSRGFWIQFETLDLCVYSNVLHSKILNKSKEFSLKDHGRSVWFFFVFSILMFILKVWKENLKIWCKSDKRLSLEPDSNQWPKDICVIPLQSSALPTELSRDSYIPNL